MYNADNNIENQKSLDSVAGLKSYQELPETNPLVVVDLNTKIIYSNRTFVNTFGLEVGETLDRLVSEPSLFDMLIGFSQSHYGNFKIDISVNPQDEENNFYNVDVERIFINESEYFILIFSSLSDSIVIEAKINNLHHALEYGEVPVIITDASGQITFTTASFEKILDTRLDELYNSNLADVFKMHLHDIDVREMRTAIKEKQSWTSTFSASVSKEEVKFMELKLISLFIEETEAYNFILTAHDITNYVLKNRLVEKTARKQESIINNISDLLLIIKKKGNYLWFENANDNFYKLFH